MKKLIEGEVYAVPNSDVYILVYSFSKSTKVSDYKIVGLTVDPETTETMTPIILWVSQSDLEKYKKVKI